MPKAIIVGASSGIGHALARELDQHGYQLALTARRLDKLNELAGQLELPALVSQMDVTDSDAAIVEMERLINEMGPVDLVILNSGIGHIDYDLDWNKELATLNTNIVGFTALAGVAYRHFKKNDHGHLVGVSSILSLRGGPGAAYNASKAFLASYLEGIRFLVAKQKLNIKVTDIKPGFVDTDIVKGRTFWMVSPEVAASSIYDAIRKAKKVAYITPRWRLIGWLSKILPDFIYHRI